MNTIYLHGSLKRQFGGPFRLSVASPAEAVRALGFQLPGFFEAIKDGWFQVVRGERKTGVELGEDQLRIGLGDKALHITPVVAGAKRSGVGKIIAGVAMIGLAAVTGGLSLGWGATAFTAFGANVSFGSIAMFGASMALQGVSNMLAQTPTAGKGADERRSFLFDGAVNTGAQGERMPIPYGKVRVGSIVISSGIDTEEVPV
ncbi:tail assembly protein [Salipiger pacificus]|nr:tail assembly protein [Alloyangia pacifica]